MVLIIGGAWQGKLSFAKSAFALSDADIWTCCDGTLHFDRRCIDRLEFFCRDYPDPVEYFKSRKEQWQDHILIIQDMSCGVVPPDAETRAWRRRTGWLMQYLSAEATQVSRIFCGLELRLK